MNDVTGAAIAVVATLALAAGEPVRPQDAAAARATVMRADLASGSQVPATKVNGGEGRRPDRPWLRSRRPPSRR